MSEYMKHALKGWSAFGLILVGTVCLCVAVANSKYEDLDCETRFALEQWYAKKYPGEHMKNATFTKEQLLRTQEEICGEVE